jgi:hypothetical protein
LLPSSKAKGKATPQGQSQEVIRLDVSLLAAPRQGALAGAGCSQHRDKIPSITMVAEMAGSLI